MASASTQKINDSNAAIAKARAELATQSSPTSPAGQTAQAATVAVGSYQQTSRAQRPADNSTSFRDTATAQIASFQQKHPDIALESEVKDSWVTYSLTYVDGNGRSYRGSGGTGNAPGLEKTMENKLNGLIRDASSPRPTVTEPPVGATKAEEQTVDELFSSALNAEGGMLDTYRGTRPQQRIPMVADMYSRGAITKQQVKALIEKGYLKRSEVATLAQNDAAQAILSPMFEE
jgi:hypothetical protein